MTRAEIEAKPNWIATYRSRLNRINCLMSAANGRGRYWETPGDGGLFPWGATSAYAPGYLKGMTFLAGTPEQSKE